MKTTAPRTRAFLLLALLAASPLAGRADQIVYDGALENGWVSWSWTAAINFANTTPAHSGAHSISVVCTNFGALYLHNNPFDASLYSALTFWINGGAGGQALTVQATLNGAAQSASYAFTPAAGVWRQVTIPLSELGVANQGNMDGFWIQGQSQAVLPAFYVDGIILLTNPVIRATNPPVSLTVNAQANRLPISPLIYGVAFASSNQLADLNFTLNRSGGNNETRYNWQIGAHNIDSDWYFESAPDAGAAPGGTADAFIADTLRGGARPMITIPMIGWVPKLGPGRAKLYSYSVGKYGPQTSTDPWLPDAGNGVSVTNNTPITWNNPNDANFPTNAGFQQAYLRHLLTRWGFSTNGGVPFYLMDNECSIWQSTHQDVHPVGPTLREIRDDILTYAGLVKSNDPNALVCAPEEWGWNGYLYSGYDQQWAGQHKDFNPAHYPDRAANGGINFVPWLLDQLHQADMKTHQRLLDYLTLHCYPQEGAVSGSDASTATALLRNQTTRVFWDTNYVDPGWINSVIMLIPRMKNWVAAWYPGTRIGITEYNWGAETNINGATAQADLLGIFGREGLDLATRWTTPAASTPTYLAMKLYRNYDGHNSTFGDTSILSAAPNPDALSAFGAVRGSDGALTLMVINKDLRNDTPINANIANFNAVGTAQRWQLTSANRITRLANITLAGRVLTDLLPAQSVTLYILPGPAGSP